MRLMLCTSDSTNSCCCTWKAGRKANMACCASEDDCPIDSKCTLSDSCPSKMLDSLVEILLTGSMLQKYIPGNKLNNHQMAKNYQVQLIL